MYIPTTPAIQNTIQIRYLHVVELHLKYQAPALLYGMRAEGEALYATCQRCIHLTTAFLHIFAYAYITIL